jgi:hypothetical protein
MPGNPLTFVNILNQPVVEPGVASLWNFDISTAQRFAAQSDIVLIGHFEGGPTGVMTPYVDGNQILEVYDPQNLHILATELSRYLYAPSLSGSYRGAYRTYVVRPEGPTPSSLTLQSSLPANVLVLTSTDAGTGANALSVEVATGSIAGKRVTIHFGLSALALDNLQNILHLAYTGNASAALLTITRVGDVATRLQTALTTPTDGSISLDLDLTTDTFATVQQLATYLNGLNGYRATIDFYGDPLLPTSELDGASAVTIRTPVALTIQYIGTGSASAMTVTNTTLITTVTAGPGGETLNIDFTAAGTDTLGELVTFIDALPAYTCTLGVAADRDLLVASALANVTGQEIRTVSYALMAQPGKMNYVHRATLGSIIQAINTQSTQVRAARVAGATAAPANLAQTFFTGGTNPVLTLSDYLDAFDLAAQENLTGGVLFVATSDPIIHDAALAWVIEQNNNHGTSWFASFGTPDNTSPQQVKTLALGRNSTYSFTTFQAGISTDGINELPPLYGAAMVAGAAAGALPATSITNMPLRLAGLPQRAKFSTAVREDLESNGVLVFREKKGTGIIIALAVTNSLSSTRLDRLISESFAREYIKQRVVVYVEPLIPRWFDQETLAVVKAGVIDAMESLKRDRIITTGIDAQSRVLPAYRPPTIRYQGGLLRITVHVFIGGELSHIDIKGTIGYQSFDITVPVAA